MALDAEPCLVARPSLGHLRMPDGSTVELTNTILIGRAPKSMQAEDGALPQIVPIPQSHISSNHLELRVEDWHVLACDLRSTNGTFLRRRGEAPVRLGERPFR